MLVDTTQFVWVKLYIPTRRSEYPHLFKREGKTFYGTAGMSRGNAVPPFSIFSTSAKGSYGTNFRY